MTTKVGYKRVVRAAARDVGSAVNWQVVAAVVGVLTVLVSL